MKKSGLKNRFKEEDRYIWNFHYTCFWCGENTADSLHHIISPSSSYYRAGGFNSSILNSAPICNQKCHIGNSQLSKGDTIEGFLKKNLEYLHGEEYKLKPNDYDFIEAYWEIYKKVI